MANVEIINIVMIVITLSTTIWAFYERVASAKDKADIKASIRIWQHQAKGISEAIQRLVYSSNNKKGGVWGNFSDKIDVGIALSALHEISESMAESLYESRFFSEDELKEIFKNDKKKEDNKKTNIKMLS